MNDIARELIIQATEQGCEMALLENSELVEFHKENITNQLNIGDIYWARIKKMLPALNAVFVDINEDKEAFLHYTDLGENFNSIQDFYRKLKGEKDLKIENYSLKPSLEKNRKIEEFLSKNDMIPVQILKEPISSKGARLSTEISFPGRYVVLIPFENCINISKKITDKDERKRLHEIVSSIKPKNFGIILRTVSSGRSVKDIHEDINNLYKIWENTCTKIHKADNVIKVFEEAGKSNTLLRDFLNDSFTKIVVNNKELAESISDYIAQIAPEKRKIVQRVTDGTLLFEKLGLNSKIKSSFNKTVLLPSGGYLIIEHTEAMHVIDVNSGVNTFKKMNLEGDEAILKLNKEAAIEIARQIRLRDLGGIIAIDFVDSKNAAIKEQIFEEMQKAMKPDRANHTILPLSKFCVMQITRSRVKPQVVVKNQEQCPSCNGTGKISSSILITNSIHQKLKALSKEYKSLIIEVHPFIYSFLKIGFISTILKWQWKYKCSVHLIQNSDLAINEYHFYDKKRVLL